MFCFVPIVRPLVLFRPNFYAENLFRSHSRIRAQFRKPTSAASGDDSPNRFQRRRRRRRPFRGRRGGRDHLREGQDNARGLRGVQVQGQGRERLVHDDGIDDDG